MATESSVWPVNRVEMALERQLKFIPECGEIQRMGPWLGHHLKLLVLALATLCGSLVYHKASSTMSNYHMGGMGKASAGNCVKGHTRDKLGIQA